MTLTKYIRYLFEFILACLGLCVIPLLPRKWITRLSAVMGNAAYSLSTKTRQTAISNLDTAFGSSLTVEEKQNIARESFRTFTLVMCDLFWFSLFTAKRIATYVEFDNSFDCFLKSSPTITIGAHIGNWEILGLAVAFRGEPCLTITAPLENPLIDKMLSRMRRITGLKLIPKEGAIKPLIKTLKAGGRIAMLIDQNILPEDGGVFVDFFGLPVPVTKAPASLSSINDSAVVFIYCIADNRGFYRAYGVPVKEASAAPLDEVEMTRKIARIQEQEIRRNPGQWLWMYKRWKYIPDGAPESRYPSYAKRYKG